jgi:uncharacterized protein YndB with AHSA1/START domain
MTARAASTTVSSFIEAPAAAVFAAFLDPGALIQWLPPAEMTGRMHRFDPRVGVGIVERHAVTAADAEPAQGKTGDREDRVEVRYVEITPPDRHSEGRIVEAVTFVSDDAAFGGEMIHTISVAPAGGGSQVTLAFENLPPGLDPADNEEGSRLSLQQLADWLRSRSV